MRGQTKIQREHLAKRAYIYVRQSSLGQVVKHPESGRRQRDLRKLASSLGWPESKIVVLDSDQGKTGQVSSGRDDFKKIVGDVSVGGAGIILGLQVSRLARNNADWFPLIEMCGLTDTLVADEEGVYDPNDYNDRLVLGIKGTLSEAYLVQMKAQLHGARWSLARRGELRRKIPSGYVWDEMGRVVFDPDERVRSAFRDFFVGFERVGSAVGLARNYAREGLVFPQRDFHSRWNGPVKWKPLGIRQATRLLKNPFYAGVYFYGERRSVTKLDPETKSRKTVIEHKPMDEWEVFIRDAHPGYITFEQFLRNQQRLKENSCMREGVPGPVRDGAALLQGIVYCGRCGRQMGVRYTGRRRYALYVCARHTNTGESIYCSSVAAERIDRWVEEKILEAIEPVGIEAALEAVAELERRSEDRRRQWEQRIEQAEYEAALARRRYEAVDPDNRLVAANLERDWEEKLREVEDVRKEYAKRADKPPIWISEEDRGRVRELALDLPRLWRAKSTKPSDRKKVVRIVIKDVWLSNEDEPWRTKVQIRWQTGLVTEEYIERSLPMPLCITTPESVVERVRELYACCKSPAEIAEQLNREGLKTGRGNPFTALRVKNLLCTRKITRR